MHRLRDGSLACGIGLAFGHADATALERLIDAADAAGASGFRTAPGRALMIDRAYAAGRVGLCRRRRATRLYRARRRSAAERRRLRRRADLRLRAYRRARAGAARCRQVAPHCDDAFTVHISGCAKGCAHAAPAALTVVGTPDGCALVANGSARDAPFTLVTTNELPQRLRGSRANESGRRLMSERAAYLRDGAAIYERSFAIIRAEADLSRFSAEEADVAVRMIHACGQVDVAAAHRVRRRSRRRGARRAAAGAPILCDAEMVAHGITRARLPAATKSFARSTIRARRRSRQKTARRARRRRSICGATASPARWSPSAMRRRRCSACSN